MVSRYMCAYAPSLKIWSHRHFPCFFSFYRLLEGLRRNMPTSRKLHPQNGQSLRRVQSRRWDMYEHNRGVLETCETVSSSKLPARVLCRLPRRIFMEEEEQWLTWPFPGFPEWRRDDVRTPSIRQYVKFGRTFVSRTLEYPFVIAEYCVPLLIF